MSDKRTPKRYCNDTVIFLAFRVFKFCLFVLLLYVPSQQLWSWQDGQFTLQHFFPGQA